MVPPSFSKLNDKQTIHILTLVYFYHHAAVLDGHAGIASAQYLEEHLFDSIKSVLTEYSLSGSCSLEDKDEEGLCCPLELTSVLTNSYKKADEKLLAWLERQPAPESGSGCTATTVLVDVNRIIVANVGDSRAVMSRTTGPIDLSVEHRVYGSGDVVQNESKRVEESGGWVDDGRVCGILAVSRAFGDAHFKGKGLETMLKEGIKDGFWTVEFADSVRFVGDPVISVPDVLEMTVSQDTDEFVIVASDGLWDVVSSKEGCDFVKRDLMKGKSPEQAAARLAEIASKRRTSDNVAIVVIDLKGEAFWKAALSSKKGKLFGLF